jgi:hypothetical protein
MGKEDLETRIATKDLSVVTCENEECGIRGDYWKCYHGNHAECKIYVSYVLRQINLKSKENK